MGEYDALPGISQKAQPTKDALEAGAPGHGCANSDNPEGAVLGASGSQLLDDVTLLVDGLPGTATTIFVCGTAQVAGGVAFGDGILCAGGTLQRFGVQLAVAGTATYPLPGDVPLSAASATVPGSGLTRRYAAWYRNPAAGFCPPATFNVSSGMRITW